MIPGDPDASPSRHRPGGGGRPPDCIRTSELLGALRLAEVHTATLVRDSVIDHDSALAALNEVSEAIKSIHSDLIASFPKLT